MAVNGNECGYAITAQNFFSEIGQGDLAPNEQAVSKARQKLHWGAFEFLLREANQEDSIEDPWLGHRVRIADGTKLNLPNYREIRKKFAIPNSKAGPGFYPQAWMVTLLNSTSGQPVAMELGCTKDSERELMLNMLPHIRQNDVILLDRGLGGGQVYLRLSKAGVYFIHRVKTSGDKVALNVQEFLQSNKASQITFVPVRDDDGQEVFLWLRLVKGPKDSEGKRIVFATNLLDEDRYTSSSIRELYRRRWSVETMYGRIKNILHIGKFHGRSLNGIMQEIYAHLLVISLTALIEYQASKERGLDRAKAVPSFKAAAHVIRRHLAIIVGCRSLSKTEANCMAAKMVEEAGRILWRKQPGRSYPRVSKQPIGHWNLCKNRKLAAAGRLRRRRAA